MIRILVRRLMSGVRIVVVKTAKGTVFQVPLAPGDSVSDIRFGMPLGEGDVLFYGLPVMVNTAKSPAPRTPPKRCKAVDPEDKRRCALTSKHEGPHRHEEDAP